MSSHVPTVTEIVTSLNSYRGENSGDLEALQRVLPTALAMLPNPEVMAALFGLFERFPDEDAYGVYWTVLHGLEEHRDYEPELCRFNPPPAISILSSDAHQDAQRWH